MAWVPPPGITLKDAYGEIIKKTTTLWGKFVRSALKLEEHEIYEIEQKFSKSSWNMKNQMFIKWEEKAGTAASVETIYAVWNHFLFPKQCPRPDLTPSGQTRSGCVADAPPVPLETEPSDENRTYHCGRVQRIVVRPTDRTFYDSKSRQGSNYKQRKGKGCTLIINNMFAHSPEGSRRGADVDLKNLKELWEKLGSEVLIKENLTADNMKKELINFCDKCDGYDYCIIFIMSHGTSDKNDDIILGNDHKEVRVKDDIINKFNNKHSHLQGVPKIFFFQCCRGTVPDEGTPGFSYVPSLRCLSSSSSSADSTGPSEVCPDANPPPAPKVPTLSDMFVSYATQSGNQAFRDTENGSWYVNAITNVFMEDAKDEHVADMMTKVHNAVSSQTTTSDDQGAMEMPEVKTTLTKKLYLYPGINRDHI